MKREAEGSGDAVVVVDVMNDFRFPGGDALWRRFRPCIDPLARLLRRARARGVPVVYANDDFGGWRANVAELDSRVRSANPAVWRSLAPLRPEARDFLVLKPRHSGFYCTPLELLLETLDVGRLVLAGVSATSCIWFTAADAHVRGYEVVVPSDTVAANSARLTHAVLELMRDSLGARTPTVRGVRLVPPRAPRHAAV